MSSEYWKIAVNAPIDQTLTYSSHTPLQRGQSVLVPLGKRSVNGIVLDRAEAPPSDSKFKIKDILSPHGERPLLSDQFMKWLEWVADYYVHPLGQVAELAFPPLKKKGRGSKKGSAVPQVEMTARPVLTEEQTRVLNDIESNSGFQTHLVFGVTGSGKTEIYLRLLDDVLKNGQQGLVIVPEISLTPQLIHRFADRFGDQIAVIHSHLTDREKTRYWWSMCEGEKKILIGARSALFCPIPNLRMIVVDEEHESSFKQDEKLRYHARDSAVVRAKFLNCPIVLGSATPSLESWHNARTGKYKLHELSRRVLNTELPEVSVVDLKMKPEAAIVEETGPEGYMKTLTLLKHEAPHETLPSPDELPFWLTPPLYQKLTERLKRGEQTALFLNRRGIAQSVLCLMCGEACTCPNCSVSLTLHAQTHMICHYCDYHDNFPRRCRTCDSPELKPIGLGTELVEKELKEIFPHARVARADRDEIQSREEMEDLIHRIERNELDVIIGTQMIAKGLDFPEMTLVGVLLADIGFNLPDFRAAERSFQLLTQVAGRAGRRRIRGEVVIQAFNPKHPSIRFARTHDFQGFAHEEFEMRNELGYPPVGRLACFRLQGQYLEDVIHSSGVLVQRLRSICKTKLEEGQIRLLGPVEAPIARLRGQYRYQVFLRSPKGQPLSALARHALGDHKWTDAGVRVSVDIDPLSML